MKKIVALYRRLPWLREYALIHPDARRIDKLPEEMSA